MLKKILFLTLLLFSSHPASAQEIEREKRAITEEQSRQIQRIERLRQTMVNLKQRMEQQGRTRSAQLLQQSIEFLGKVQMEKTMAEVVRHLEEGRVLQGMEKEQVLLNEIEELLAILLDRKDLEELEKQLEKYQQLAAFLESLRKKETELRQDIEKLNEEAQTKGETEISKELENLINQQAELLRKTETAHQVGLPTLKQILKDLNHLIQNQEKSFAEIEKLSKESPQDDATAETQKKALQTAEEIAAEIQKTKKVLAEAAEEKTRAEKGEISAEEWEQIRNALAEQLRGAAKNLKQEKTAPPAQEKAAKSLEELANQIAKGQDPQAKPEAIKDMQEARDQALEKAKIAKNSQENPRSRQLAQKQRSLRRQAEKLARTLDSAREIPENENLSPSLWEAAEKLSESADELDQNRPSSAQQPAQQALDSLKKALQQIQNATEKEEEQIQPRLKEIAKKQKELEEELGKLEDEIPNRLKKDELQNKQSEALQESIKKAKSFMQQASSQLNNANPESAEQAQRQALEQMRKAQSSLGENRSLSPQQKEQSEELAQRQKEIQQEILELAKRLQEQRNNRYQSHLENAGKSAGEASDSLNEGNPEQAEPQAEETEKYLNLAKDAVQREQEKYLDLRQEELLFRIGEELRGMIEAHEKAMETTTEADAERKDSGGNPSRALRLRISRIGREEQGIATDCNRVATGLDQEGAQVFSFLLRANEEDLQRIAELLGPDGEYKTGELTQSLQQDVAERFGDLQQALKEEMRRRQQDQQNQSQNQNQQRQLVPDVAELKMLKKLEQYLEERTKTLIQLNEKGLAEGPMLQREIDRIANRHSRITDLFLQFKKRK